MTCRASVTLGRRIEHPLQSLYQLRGGRGVASAVGLLRHLDQVVAQHQWTNRGGVRGMQTGCDVAGGIAFGHGVVFRAFAGGPGQSGP